MKTVALWLSVVFLLSIYPFEAGGGFRHADKLLHFVIYGITCALFFSVMRTGALKKKRGDLNVRAALLLSVFLATGYGLLMEAVQGFLGTRSFSLFDLLFDFLGASLAAVLISAKFRRAS